MPVNPIRYVTGDATTPEGDGPKIIAHVCNDLGLWGAGFLLSVSARWPEPRDAYLRTCELNPPGALLGRMDLITVAPGLHVANMIAQRGVNRDRYSHAPIRYPALKLCLMALAMHAQKLGASVHMPRIGCGAAGGRWDQVEPIILGQLCPHRIPVTVYDPAMPPVTREQPGPTEPGRPTRGIAPRDMTQRLSAYRATTPHRGGRTDWQ